MRRAAEARPAGRDGFISPHFGCKVVPLRERGIVLELCHPDRVVLCVCAGTSSTGSSQPWRKGPAVQEAVAGRDFSRRGFHLLHKMRGGHLHRACGQG